MLRFLIGTFVLLHGLVHLWYFTLSQRLVEFQAEMGWSGKSWLFTNLLGDAATRSLASALYVLATLGFVAGGIGIFIQGDWWRPVVIGSAIFSSVIVLLFWDGALDMVVEKGLLGLIVNIIILVALIGFDWPPTTF